MRDKQKAAQAAKRYEGRVTIPHRMTAKDASRAGEFLGRSGNAAAAKEKSVADASVAHAKQSDAPSTETNDFDRYLDASSYAKRREARRFDVHRLPRRIVITCIIAALLVVGFVSAAGALSSQARDVRNHASTALTQLATLSEQIRAGNYDGATEAASAVTTEAAALDNLTSGPLWSAATIVPGVGGNARCARELSSALKQISDEVITPLVALANEQGSIKVFSDGGIDLDLLMPALKILVDSSQTSTDVAARVDALAEPSDAQLAKALESTRDAVDALAAYGKAASTIEPHIEGMLGGDGTRSYLVVVLDPATLRSVGGQPVCEGILTASNGALVLQTLESDAAGLSYLYYGKTVEVTEEEQEVFGDEIASEPDVMATMTDKTRAAELLVEAYQNATEDSVDGALLLDPYVIQILLRATGTVTLEGARTYDEYDSTYTEDGSSSTKSLVLGSESTARYLLHSLAKNEGSWQQGSLFADVCNATLGSFFDRMSTADQAEVFASIGEAIASERTTLWMSRSDEQKLVDQLASDATASESEASGEGSETAEMGVYLNDETGGRIDWYLDAKSEIVDSSTSFGGDVSYTITTTLTNNITKDTLNDLWSSSGGYTVLGSSWQKRSDADIITRLYLVAPEGASISDISAASSEESSDEGNDGYYSSSSGPSFEYEESSFQNRALIACDAQVDRGETLTITYTLHCPAGQAPVVVRQTPGCVNTAGE